MSSSNKPPVNKIQNNFRLPSGSHFIQNPNIPDRKRNLLPSNPRRIIEGKKYGCFRNVFGLAFATKWCLGKKSFVKLIPPPSSPDLYR